MTCCSSRSARRLPPRCGRRRHRRALRWRRVRGCSGRPALPVGGQRRRGRGARRAARTVRARRPPPSTSTASIGVAVYPLHGEDADRLLQHANAALSVAKRTGSSIEIYGEETGHELAPSARAARSAPTGPAPARAGRLLPAEGRHRLGGGSSAWRHWSAGGTRAAAW